MKFVASLLVILVLSALSTSAAPVCGFGTAPCFVACGSPPRLTDANQAALWLRSTEYGSLNWLDQASAVVTTQFFKCLGINGWKRYGFYVYAIGTVEQAKTSWDGLRTVDIALADFNDTPVYRSLPATHYIRAEIIRHVWKHLEHPPRPGDCIRVQGELHWDGHGFLEIHPSQNYDVQYLSVSVSSKACKPPASPAGA